MPLRDAVCSRVIRAGRTAWISPMAGPYCRATVPPARPRKMSAIAAPLAGGGALVDVEHDLPGGARLSPVDVAEGHYGLQAGQVEAVGVAVADVPRQGAEAFPEAGGPAGAAGHATARADRLAVACLEVGAPDVPVGDWARH